MGASNNQPDNEEMGIVGGHAQSVISVHKYGKSKDVIKLVKLRNPWGRHEWRGKWADTDIDTWNSNPGIKKDLYQNSDDGLF